MATVKLGKFQSATTAADTSLCTAALCRDSLTCGIISRKTDALIAGEKASGDWQVGISRAPEFLPGHNAMLGDPGVGTRDLLRQQATATTWVTSNYP